tara:strand:+ start:543 stop:932 length:390 start_codon:yes stop_codon:yes gene_type:complete
MDKQTYLDKNILIVRNISELEYFKHGISIALINNGNFGTSISMSYDNDELNETFYNNNVIIEENKPTWSDVETAIQEVKDFWNSKSYARARVYPSIQEQLDMQYHDEVNNTTTWKDAIAQVKDKYPKEE